MNWGERFYRALLLCYPAEFRCEYAAEMTQAFRDRRREESAVRLWFDLIADTFLTASKEHCQMLLNDLRYTARTLRKAPGFTGAAVLTLALGIGANAAIFSVVNAVMLRPLPFVHPERLVQVAERNDKLNLPVFSSSVLNYLSWKEQNHSFESMGAIGGTALNLTGRGDPEPYSGATITPSLFPLLGLHPVAGRAFGPDEDKPGSPPVVMVGEALWRGRFGGDRNLIGQTLTLNGTSYTVVGIAPAALNVLTGSALAIPLTIDYPQLNRLQHVVTTVARLRPGVTLTQAQAEMEAVSHQVGTQYPEVKDWGIRLISFYKTFVSDQLQTALLVLLAAVAAVLLIACANVANLLLSRAASRQREIAVRVAMGASSARLLRQLFTESIALSAVGGGIGILAAVWVVKAANGSVLQGVLPVPDVAVDSTVLWFSAAVTLVTGILFGMSPAWQASRTNLHAVLKQGGRLSTGGVRPLLRNCLVGGELALATVLLIGAGLLVQSLMRMQQVRLGFRTGNLLTFQVALPPTRYQGKAWDFDRRLLDSLTALPGVRGAALSSGIPFGAGNYTTTPMTPVGNSQLPAGASIPLDWRIVSPGYFRTMDIPVRRGSGFAEQYAAGAPTTMIVSEETARRFWGAADPLGQSIRIVGSGRVFTVIGVVGNVHNTAVNVEPGPAVYMSAAERPFGSMDVVVRTSGKPEQTISGVRKALHDIDPELPLATVRTMDHWLANSTAQPRLNGMLLGVFAAVALLIAAIGIYGVLSYSVNQRTREIGLRMAMGAQPHLVVRLVVREGMVVALAGIAVGLAGALVAGRSWATLLFGVRPADPATFAMVAAALALVSLTACYIPARRASRVDPIVALREE